MSKRSRKKSRRRKGKPEGPILLEYYQLPFLLIGQELARRGLSSGEPHPLRQSFWRLVPDGEYDLIQARQLLTSYLVSVEQELAEIIRPQSIAYWLHLYRRIGLGSAGPNDTPATIGWVRQIFEAAIQKYAQFGMCNRVAFSNQVPPGRILRGLLMGPEFTGAREYLAQKPQLVLTDFGTEEMHEVYQAEKLAYEIWRATAALRIIGKGATLLVGSQDPYFADNRSDELNRLVRNYDDRHRDPNVSATGTVFEALGRKPRTQGFIFMPVYNLAGVPAEEFKEWFRLFGIELRETPLGEPRTNFLWAPFNIRAYYEAHKPFSTAFECLHGLPLEWVLAVVAGLYLRLFYLWLEDHLRIVHFWQRAYEGPHTLDYLVNEVTACLTLGIEALELGLSVNEIDIARVFSFLKLSEQGKAAINLITAGPHSLFLPVGTTHAFIDYCWGFRLLYHMFFGVELADQNFKGDALERLIHRGQSVLPLKECKSLSGTVRQIDAAFKVGEALVIVECRAVGRSFGVDRGDPQALQYRRQKIEEALDAIDEKARWLAQNPVGTNYDIRPFARILPLAVTPFVEYIPSTNSWYWLSETLPRVLTPQELQEALENGVLEELAKTSSHKLPVSRWR
jgi:hypothetical protein